MRKLDIMNNMEPVAPGEFCNWQVIGGKVKRVKDAGMEIVDGEIKVRGPVVENAIKEVNVVEEKIDVKIKKKEDRKVGRKRNPKNKRRS